MNKKGNSTIVAILGIVVVITLIFIAIDKLEQEKFWESKCKSSCVAKDGEFIDYDNFLGRDKCFCEIDGAVENIW